ncbi:MAG: nucleotidyltransferase domain-containing protein [Gammaproteobacteria bacterium]|nr:nucleotidyltransferase domain-containing protein [Gammaproteobacteria bacterium]MBP9729168.1 nucleotidyltransferase domain-containing protein [Gammaproteobacteria bacterium]
MAIQASIALEVIFKKCFLKTDKLWLFGSRVDLNRKGGDIDLYIETHLKTANEAADMKLKFITGLQHVIGEQKIDVVLNIVNISSPLPIYTIAITEGVGII